MIDNYGEHIEALNRNGATITGTVNMQTPVNAYRTEDMNGIYDLVFLFTKQTANEKVLNDLLPHLDADSTVCTLQNGVPEPYIAEIIGKDRTVGGTVLWGATFIGPGVSCLTQNLKNLKTYFDIGEIDGKDTGRIHRVKAENRRCG